MNILEQFMIPICIGIIYIGISPLPLVYHHPRALRIFLLIINPRPELPHIFLCVKSIIPPVGSLEEKIVQVNRVISSRFKVSGCRWILETKPTAITDCRIPIVFGTIFSRDEDNAERSSRSIHRCCRCILDDRN